MDLIQFRIHPSVGMARFGESKEYYFLGPQFPRFMQEQFPHLCHKSVALRHPDAPVPVPPAVASPKPADGLFRDAAGEVMSQAARFRIFAYVFCVGSREPYKVVEVTSTDADIEWTVTVANRKTVRSATGKVEVNDPATVTMTTNPPSAPSSCKKTGQFPNLAWLALESGTGRLDVIGNEGEDLDLRPNPPVAPPERLYEFDWLDTAGDGPVTAVIKPKAAFLSRFAGFKYLIPGTKDPQSLPSSGAVDAVSAWVVVNMPDYVPDFGHFVSLWDLVLAQSWKQVADKQVSAVDGRHFLATTSNEINDYAFYDYETHIHPLLTVFSDVNSTSGQTRNASGDNVKESGIVIQEKLTATASDTALSLSASGRSALRLQAAAMMNAASNSRAFAPFNMVLSVDAEDPFGTGHEIVQCTDIADDGTLTVARATAGTAAATWASGKIFLARPKGTFTEADLIADIAVGDTVLKVESVSAHKMLQPSAAAGDLHAGPFFIAITDGTDVEWVKCTKNDKKVIQPDQRYIGQLTVVRAQLGTTEAAWTKAAATLIAGGGGHKTYDARTNMKTLATTRGAAHKRLFDRLRLPYNLYSNKRKFPMLNVTDPDKDITHFPRQYGRRYDITGPEGIDTVSGGTIIPSSTIVDPEGSLAPQWSDPKIREKQGKACKGEPMGTGTPAVLKRIGELDDLYWIATERDMPMLKDYALTQLQFDQFEYWATRKVGVVDEVLSAKLRWAPLFTVLFEGTPIGAFLRTPGHTAEEYFQEFARRLPRYTPAMLDMANMTKMLGGSFLPGIEVGREGGVPKNWSLTHGATKYFPDIRFHPSTGATQHQPGMLTKDLAIPWFRDFISCDETYWPTSRPQIVNNDNGFGYMWLYSKFHDTADYWRNVGFIRRADAGVFVERERNLDIRE